MCHALSTQVSDKQLRRANGCSFLRYVSGQGEGILRGIEGFHDNCKLLISMLIVMLLFAPFRRSAFSESMLVE